jgi:hypothetical protein
MALAGREEQAGQGSESILTIHAPFTTEVECKIAPVRADSSPMTLPDATRCS